MNKIIITFIKKNKITLLTFLTVGALSAGVYFLSFSICWKLLRLSYPYAISIAYVLSVLFHFTANRNITFKSYGTNILPQTLKYLTMVIMNYGITLLIVNIAVEILHLSPYIGIVCAIGATVGSGYLMSRLWVFPVRMH
ncbi:MAG: hypothetical protein ACD_44C00102G0003 [uncultured bacterium]|nr:MAG: hypothetical protein ACD_44C00102G0003 [uncultured bacterium]OGT45963.1 MAG: hypothetical protein A3E83_02680 [Gammaproteobacteria bacterium RIFCSPHIGHO2_12_FULL_41_20]